MKILKSLENVTSHFIYTSSSLIQNVLAGSLSKKSMEGFGCLAKKCLWPVMICVMCLDALLNDENVVCRAVQSKTSGCQILLWWLPAAEIYIMLTDLQYRLK